MPQPDGVQITLKNHRSHRLQNAAVDRFDPEPAAALSQSAYRLCGHERQKYRRALGQAAQDHLPLARTQACHRQHLIRR